MAKCDDCQGEILSSKCINIEGSESKHEYLNEFIKTMEQLRCKIESGPEVDMKSLSSEDLCLDDILQTLIDETIKLKGALGGTTGTGSTDTPCPSLNWVPIDSCNSCNRSFCEQMQLLIDTVGTLKRKVDAL